MKSPWLIALVLVLCAGLAYWLTRPPATEPKAQLKESRRHPASPSDLQAVNQHIGQNVAGAVLERMDGQAAVLGSLQAGKPLVLVFFSHDCPCSLEFSAYFASAMEKSKGQAVWAFVFADTTDQIGKFVTGSGFALPVFRDPEARLSRSLGFSKSGCFTLVNVDGTISAIWPGVSSEGLRDLFTRLQLSPSLVPILPSIPQSPTAGCPL
jgi:peroxiredoxin